MSDGCWLRALRVRMDRENRVPMRVGKIEQRLPKVERRAHESKHELTLAHPVHRHVDVVAATSRM